MATALTQVAVQYLQNTSTTYTPPPLPMLESTCLQGEAPFSRDVVKRMHRI